MFFITSNKSGIDCVAPSRGFSSPSVVLVAQMPAIVVVFNGFGKPGKLLNNFVVTPGVHDLDTTNHRLAVTQIEAMAR